MKINVLFSRLFPLLGGYTAVHPLFIADGWLSEWAAHDLVNYTAQVKVGKQTCTCGAAVQTGIYEAIDIWNILSWEFDAVAQPDCKGERGPYIESGSL